MSRKKIIAIVAVTVAAIAVFVAVSGGNSKNDDRDKAVVEKGKIAEIIEETGNIHSTDVNSFFSNGINKVEKINVKIGDEVKAGDVLLVFDNTVDLEIERVQKEIEALRATYNEAVKGADFETINNVKLQIESLKNDLALAKNEKRKAEELFSQGAVTETERDKAVNAVIQLENQLGILENNYNLLTKGLSSNVRNQYEAQIEGLAISLKILEKAKDNYLIKANFDGIVTEQNTFEGDIPMAGTPIIEVQNNKELAIYTDFLVDEAVKITEGMKIEAENEDMDLEIKGLTVNKIYPKAESKVSELGIEQKRVTVEVLLPAEYNNLTIGSNVTVKAIIREKDGVVIVPNDSIYELEGKDYVTVAGEKEDIEKEVQLGIEGDDFTEIISGLEEGETVIVD